MNFIFKKKYNSIENYFRNMDWKKGTSEQFFFYVKMMNYPMVLEACVHFNNIWQKYFRNEKENSNEKIQCQKILKYLCYEAILRRAKKMKLSKSQLKKKYQQMKIDLTYFLRTQERWR